MKLFIIIVSFNGGEILVNLISDLIKEKGVKIVVVDNGSREKFQIPNSKFQIDLIKNKKNVGFAKAANIGIRYALQNDADRILLLNQDVIIQKAFIQTLINNPADIVSPVIKFKQDNKWIYDHGGKVNCWIGRTYHIESSDPSTAVGMRDVDYVSGCAMLVKKEVFEKVGFFDERFFLYFEDVDFCLRSKRVGFKIVVEPKSIITHQLKEGKERSFFKKYHLLRSNAIFINKYLKLNRLLGYLYLGALAIKMML